MRNSIVRTFMAYTRSHTYAMIVSLFLVGIAFLAKEGKATIADARSPAPIKQSCLEAYQPGQMLFTPETAQKIFTSPGELKSHIKSISNKRYWGLADNLRLKQSDHPKAPFILELKIPKGAINPGNKSAPRGGAGYHWTPELPANTRTACLSYSVWFPEDFDFVKGGKLPGIFGGTGPSGGKLVTGKNGFSTRYMWRTGGNGEVYAYIIGNNKRGISIDRGAWRFKRGAWTSLSQEVVLNAPGQKNGEVRVWVDGKLVIERTQLNFRTIPDVTISGVMAHVFFGGKDPSWASTKDTLVRVTPFDFRWHKNLQKDARNHKFIQ